MPERKLLIRKEKTVSIRNGIRMSPLQSKDKVIAVLCADIHLSARAPRARRVEDDWFSAMAKPLQQITTAAEKFHVPIICAGDVFDYWKAEPELINFALGFLPTMYAIPGQHDMPLHSMELLKKSAFWTMALADKIIPVINKKPIKINNLMLHGFPFGEKLSPLERENNCINLAVCHDYIWTDNCCYPGASEQSNISSFKHLVKGYDACVFGDNHKGFLTEIENVSILNCGSLMRRNSDQKNYEPKIGLLCESGKILQHSISVRGEKFICIEEEEEKEKIVLDGMLRDNDMRHLIEGINDLERKVFDFGQALEIIIRNKHVKQSTRKIIMQALETK